ncbi:cation:proton antiporter [Macrococcoides canis]|uniref:cation:proton antiporter n=1 Tax=Macrococcoides canis TaxID=1855823 RepID=UPI001F387E04|nr:cation:proton antiporter [Macrococcus canis]UJS27940.1 cation:proton antiporter [Macrococcus canis]
MIPELLHVGLLLLLLFIGGFIGHKINIPDVIIFLTIGLVLSFFIAPSEVMSFAAELGIVLMFFMLGMEFPFHQLKRMALDIYKPGLLDLLLSFGITLMICLLLNFDLPQSLLIGAVVYATSSSITVKLLEKSKRMVKRDSDFLLGLLIFEDIISPILVVVVASIYIKGNVSISELGVTGLEIILLIAGALIIGKFIFSKAEDFIKQYIDEDFFVLFIVGVGILYGGIAVVMNLSEVFGAFLAGIMLAESRQAHNLQNMVRNLRDLLMPIFFIQFGMNIDITQITMIPILLIIILWSVVAKVATGYIGGRQYGLTKLESWRAGLSFTQRGEFSIIVASLGAEQIQTFSGIFILCSAVIGVILFQLSPTIAKKLK